MRVKIALCVFCIVFYKSHIRYFFFYLHIRQNQTDSFKSYSMHEEEKCLDSSIGKSHIPFPTSPPSFLTTLWKKRKKKPPHLHILSIDTLLAAAAIQPSAKSLATPKSSCSLTIFLVRNSCTLVISSNTGPITLA